MGKNGFLSVVVVFLLILVIIFWLNKISETNSPKVVSASNAESKSNTSISDVGCDRVCVNPFDGSNKAEFTSLLWGCYIDNISQSVKFFDESDMKKCGWHKYTHIIAIDGSDITYNKHVGDYRKIIDNIIFKYIHNNLNIVSNSTPFLKGKNCMKLAFGDELQIWRIEQGSYPIFQHQCKWVSDNINSKAYLWTTQSKNRMIKSASEIIRNELVKSLSSHSFSSSQLFPNPQNTDLVLSINEAVHYANSHPNEMVFYYLISPDLEHNPSIANKHSKVHNIPKNLLITWNMQDNPKLKGKVQNMEAAFRKAVGLNGYNGQDFFTTFRGSDLNP